MSKQKHKCNIKNQYWFYIETYVHVSIKKKSLLLYNSLTGKALEYFGKQKIINLVKKLRFQKNPQVILLKEKDLEYPVIYQFVADIRKYFMGDLINLSYSRGKPVQMMPVVTIKRDVKYLKNDKVRSVGENMMEYLTEFFLYINNACDQKCDICGLAYKQFPCCTIKENKKGEPDISKVKGLIDETKGSQLINLNILGGNIFAYSKFRELSGIINHLPVQKNFYSHYLNIVEESGKLEFLNPRSSLLKILAPPPINREKIKDTLNILETIKLKYKFIFIIQSEDDFEKAETLISTLNIGEYEYQPLYDGENLEFFKENVFTDKKEVLAAKPKMRNTYVNSVVNSLNFGRLTILNNGHIYANVNASRLGILGKDSLYDVLYKEMYHGKSWRRIRKNVAPCKRCTFEALCPPLTNYTHAIGRNNLCHKSF